MTYLAEHFFELRVNRNAGLPIDNSTSEKLRDDLISFFDFPINDRANIYEIKSDTLRSYVDIPHENMVKFFESFLGDDMPSGDNIGLSTIRGFCAHNLDLEECVYDDGGCMRLGGSFGKNQASEEKLYSKEERSKRNVYRSRLIEMEKLAATEPHALYGSAILAPGLSRVFVDQFIKDEQILSFVKNKLNIP